MEAPNNEILIVGDGFSGKTSLVHAFCGDEFPRVYVPTTSEMHICNLKVDDKIVKLILWDSGCEEGFEKIRKLKYQNINVVLLVFSVVRPESFKNSIEKWVPEIKKKYPEVPIILVGNKKDMIGERGILRDLSVKGSYGAFMAERIGAFSYMECSAKTKTGVRAVFETAAKAAVHRKNNTYNRVILKKTLLEGRTQHPKY